MLILRLLPLVFLVVWNIENASAITPNATSLRIRLLKGYNARVRPVKKESTVTQVSVFLNIANVEKIDEAEQTVLVHGHLWASWKDEYMTWDRIAENITKLTIPTYRLWQPALSLYNSARGNAWHLYMNGMPATVYHSGKVWASGAFSFHVTCLFDFTNWPFDEQKCPIVIAEWVYGLNQVNLTDPYIIREYTNPTIRLSYDPMGDNKREHVGGWEVRNSWKKHCYWGPSGCTTEEPEKRMADYYWSLLEFGIYLKRHAKYYEIAYYFPILVTTLMILVVFWIDSVTLSVTLIMFNLVFEATFGWYIMKQIPPGSGSTPKIVQHYMMNCTIMTIQFLFVVYSNLFEERLPTDYAFNFGFDITELPKKFGIQALFVPKAFSFDPQEILGNTDKTLDTIIEEGSGSARASIGIGNPLNDEGLGDFGGSFSSASTTDSTLLVDFPTTSDSQPILRESIEDLNVKKTESKKSEKPQVNKKLRAQFHTIKRFMFLIVVIADITFLLYCRYT